LQAGNYVGAAECAICSNSSMMLRATATLDRWSRATVGQRELRALRLARNVGSAKCGVFASVKAVREQFCGRRKQAKLRYTNTEYGYLWLSPTKIKPK
jgi:hypothetical protein